MVGVAVIAAIRVPPRSSRRVLIQEVRVGSGPGRPGCRWNLDGAWTFNSLEREIRGEKVIEELRLW